MIAMQLLALFYKKFKDQALLKKEQGKYKGYMLVTTFVAYQYSIS